MNILNHAKITNWLRKNVNDRNTAFGAIISSLFCPICFPALAGIASALGLSFLTRYEGVFLLLFHLFALISLFTVWRGVRKHRKKLSLLLSGLGMLLIYGALFQLFPLYAFVYPGIAFLVSGAYLNAHYSRKFGLLNCDCETVPGNSL